MHKFPLLVTLGCMAVLGAVLYVVIVPTAPARMVDPQPVAQPQKLIDSTGPVLAAKPIQPAQPVAVAAPRMNPAKTYDIPPIPELGSTGGSSTVALFPILQATSRMWQAYSESPEADALIKKAGALGAYASAARLAPYDKNNDGNVDPDLRGKFLDADARWEQQGLADIRKEYATLYDTNHDGKLSAEEMQRWWWDVPYGGSSQGAWGLTTFGDSNKDGLLDPMESKAMDAVVTLMRRWKHTGDKLVIASIGERHLRFAP